MTSQKVVSMEDLLEELRTCDDPERRRRLKVVVFPLLYGSSPDRIAEIMGRKEVHNESNG